MKSSLTFWVERYFYAPGPFERLLSLLLTPLGWIYCTLARCRYERSRPVTPPLPVVSVGNLTVGGSGKTPLVTALAGHFEKSAVVLRGYGRQSHGMIVVRDGSDILCDDVSMTGDEAMLYALKLSETIVIVSEERMEGIAKAAELGATAVFLDDGYGKHAIEKLDLLIDVPTSNRRCLPAGPFRELLWEGKAVRWVREGEDFRRLTRIEGGEGRMSLVTAIARPQRLDPYLPEVAGKHYFPDHYAFNREELLAILKEDHSDTLLVTYKDYVKMRHFDLPVAVLELSLELDEKLLCEVEAHIRKSGC